jgi:hypothetical protein
MLFTHSEILTGDQKKQICRGSPDFLVVLAFAQVFFELSE